MSATPETDAAYNAVVISTEAGDSLPKATAMLKLARKLERERDELAALLAAEKSTRNSIIEKGVKTERERDEAIRQFENLKAAAIHTCHEQCQRPMCVLRRERDEAREVASGLAVQEERVEEAQKELSSIHRWIERNHPDGFIDSMTFHQNLERVTDRWYERLERVERERDEARAELDAYREVGHHCDSHRDMMGDCIVCSMEEKK